MTSLHPFRKINLSSTGCYTGRTRCYQIVCAQGLDQPGNRLHLGRSHTTVCRERRRNSSKSGYRAQIAERRAQKRRRMPRHYRSLSQPGLIAYVDEKLCNDWSFEQIAGRIRLDFPQDQSMRIGAETIYPGSMRPHSSAIQAIFICAVPADAAGGKPDMARADACFLGVLIYPRVHRLLLTDSGLGTGKLILPVPPGARRRWSVATSAKAVFWC